MGRCHSRILPVRTSNPIGRSWEKLADFDLFNNRLDLAYWQLDYHSLGQFWNGFADRRVSCLDILFRQVQRMLERLRVASHQ